MITIFHHKELKISVVTKDGMPSLVITDDDVQDFDFYMATAKKLARQIGKQAVTNTIFDLILRYPDEKIGWQRL